MTTESKLVIPVGLWIGLDDKREEWVILNRQLPANRDGGTLYFVGTSDWSIREEAVENWRAPRYIEHQAVVRKYFAKDPTPALQRISSLLDLWTKHGTLFDRKVTECVDARISEELAVREEERRRKDEEAEAAALRRKAEVAEQQQVLARQLARQKQRREAEVQELRETLVGHMSASREAVLRDLEKRRIRHLLHFTQLTNLEGIARDGIVPRAYLLDGSYAFNDQLRLDGYPEASSVSIAFPNYKMFYSYRCENPKLSWVVLGIEPSVLTNKPCAFFRTNAAWSGSRLLLARDKAKVSGAAGYSAMFDSGLSDFRGQLGIPDAFCTDPQAEVLVFDRILPSDILFVGFASKDHLDLESAQRVTQLRKRVLPAFFSPRLDYPHWQNQYS